jgi:hypothetical protein
MNTFQRSDLRPDTTGFWPAVLACILSACSHMPQSAKDLSWDDHLGDRGRGVLERDYAMCSDLVESRRSSLAGCMLGRGWSVAP